MLPQPTNDESYTYTADLLSGPVFFGAIGYGLDHWVFHTGHRLVIAGLVLGIVVGLYAVLIRYRRAIASLEQAKSSAKANAVRADGEATTTAHTQASDKEGIGVRASQ